mmetsp:Transcript_56230/g.162996  ORF Transcript_56230/g.162996 Transcript_56230/m.162996 type:complete len:292 (-) Transcript_56230:318-1193(-)
MRVERPHTGADGDDCGGRRSVAHAVPSEVQAQQQAPASHAAAGGAVAPQLRKTKLCSYHQAGHCRLGSACAFAHDAEELRAPPDLRKTRLCHLYAVGRCQDRQCSFAHGHAELRATGQFYKRTLCKFHLQGKCRNSGQCRFAHGLDELRVDQAGVEGGALGGRSRIDAGARERLVPRDAEPMKVQPMKVSLPMLSPAVGTQLPLLRTVMAQQPASRLLPIRAADLMPSDRHAEEMCRLQNQLGELWLQFALSQEWSAVGPKELLDFAAGIVQLKSTRAGGSGILADLAEFR